MLKFLIVLFLIPFAIQAQQDNILVYKTKNASPDTIKPLPGTWRVYKKDKTVDSFPNATMKVQKITVPVEEANVSAHNETKVYPQPFDKSINIEFEILKDANVDFNICNQSGQVVFSSNNLMEKGKNKFSWDGIDNQGVHVQSGTYFLKIKQANSVIIEKLLLIK